MGVVFAVRLFAAALVAPFAGMLADRYRRERVLLLSNGARIVLVGAAAVGVFLDAAPMIVYALAVAAAIATTPFRSAQAALTPAIARTPGELTAANAVVSTVESLAVFVGPALAGLLLAVTSTGVVFTANALMLVVSTFFVLRIRARSSEGGRELEAATIVSEAFAGFRALGQNAALADLDGIAHGADAHRRCVDRSSSSSWRSSCSTWARRGSAT